MLKIIVAMFLLVFLLPACTVVKLSPSGEKARVLDATEVANCQYVGKTTSTTTARVVGVKRHDKAINLELESLARNAAERLGGDTVVAEGMAVEGKQTYRVYRCIP